MVAILAGYFKFYYNEIFKSSSLKFLANY